nr:MAG TPA: hypothetical protein [Caudoviricetes sp.]
MRRHLLYAGATSSPPTNESKRALCRGQRWIVRFRSNGRSD